MAYIVSASKNTLQGARLQGRGIYTLGTRQTTPPTYIVIADEAMAQAQLKPPAPPARSTPLSPPLPKCRGLQNHPDARPPAAGPRIEIGPFPPGEQQQQRSSRHRVGTGGATGPVDGRGKARRGERGRRGSGTSGTRRMTSSPGRRRAGIHRSHDGFYHGVMDSPFRLPVRSSRRPPTEVFRKPLMSQGQRSEHLTS